MSSSIPVSSSPTNASDVKEKETKTDTHDSLSIVSHRVEILYTSQIHTLLNAMYVFAPKNAHCFNLRELSLSLPLNAYGNEKRLQSLLMHLHGMTSLSQLFSRVLPFSLSIERKFDYPCFLRTNFLMSMIHSVSLAHICLGLLQPDENNIFNCTCFETVHRYRESERETHETEKGREFKHRGA